LDESAHGEDRLEALAEGEVVDVLGDVKAGRGDGTLCGLPHGGHEVFGDDFLAGGRGEGDGVKVDDGEPLVSVREADFDIGNALVAVMGGEVEGEGVVVVQVVVDLGGEVLKRVGEAAEGLLRGLAHGGSAVGEVGGRGELLAEVEGRGAAADGTVRRGVAAHD
jgi:hypothetical protein